VWDRAKRIFTTPIDRIIDFAKGLASGILDLIKEAILRPLGKLAEGTRAYPLLKAVLGEDPITGDKAEPDFTALIGGLMELAGQGDVWARVQEANAIPRIVAWFKGTVNTLKGFVQQIPTLAMNLFNELTLEDVVLLVGAFNKIRGVFGSFVGNFISWAIDAGLKLLEIVFDVVSPGAWGYVQRTGAALKSIVKNPLPFVGNLAKAAKLGFQNFAGNFFEHLKKGLLEWLTGSLPGVYIPKALSLPEFGKLALSVFGVSWAQIRGKIVKALGSGGELIMTALEGVFDVVIALKDGGPAAAWKVIQDKLTSLKDSIVDGITSFITEAVVTKAVPKLVAMFIPGAGFISAIVSIYDMVMVFVEKISKIIQVVTAFLNSIVAIAAGNIGAAAAKVESILGGMLSLAISFLAGFAGLGKVADKVRGIIEKLRDKVDKALDAAINFVIGKAKALFAYLFKRGKDGKPGKNKKDQATEAFAEVAATIEQAKAAGAKPDELTSRIAPLKQRYPFKKLVVVSKGDEIDVDAEINPVKVWKYAGKIKMKIIYDAAWPLDEFMSKAKAIQATATAGKLATLPMNPITGKQKSTADERKGEQDALREKVRSFIVTKVSDPTEQARLLAGLKLLQADHQQELQMAGKDKPGNLALIEGEMNRALGWDDFRPAMASLPPGTPISSVVIDTSALDKQRQNKKKMRKTGVAAALRDELMKYAAGGEKSSVRSWFKLEE
jgi:hypothetical protein